MSEKVTVTDLVETITELGEALGTAVPTKTQWKYVLYLANQLQQRKAVKEAAEEEEASEEALDSLFDAILDMLPFEMPTVDERKEGQAFELDGADLDKLWANSIFAEKEEDKQKEEPFVVRFVLGYVDVDDKTPTHVWTCVNDEVDQLLKEIRPHYGRIIVTDDYREGRKPDPIVYSKHREQYKSYPPLHMLFAAKMKKQDEERRANPLGGILPTVNPWEIGQSPKKNFEDVDAMKVPTITAYSLTVDDDGISVSRLL